VEPSSNPASDDIDAMLKSLFHWARHHPELPLMPMVERELVRQALREVQGNQVKAARLLGMTRATLRKRIEKFDIRQEINVD
jgi:two-component system nitrogen regulation response regulator GlnG